ncbi:hypothetical protein BGK38_03470 [Corynebacterium diphtheriae]|uniref:Uncharacterized protein n=1 Tax=Corynebacterium diphtheriae TaxID=1717 RepID=A0A6J4WSL7_CORDP|nr:hypothetical protein [Corynebacterium diphtheriae]MBG9221679.1 hypothetical protein [Corynebacterium diphtheriae bv. mitis]MBG9301013.1 hypothetical protein [Corynebacterium diphtheriae bv. mitis]ODS19581.1 hypothetical protein BGK38_03470 [Corynebacterium diphtheriae]OEH69726.1 hypothetical protein BHU47_04535 [Corynebacterium diphtheriae]OEH70309.1 hypothetical protein BHU48_05875 [Corynebacterium diphtheriae]
MAHTTGENLFTMKRVLRNLEVDHDALREALADGRRMRDLLPYGDYINRYRNLTRDPMVVAIHKQFHESGLGGLTIDESMFPLSLRFEDDDVTLVFRRPEGFRHGTNEESSQRPLIERRSRIVLFWKYAEPGTDALKRISLQMFDNEGPLEEATMLSEKIPLLTKPESLTTAMFIPTHADEPRFVFGS